MLVHSPMETPTVSAHKHTRAYKACLTCRQRKAKCDLGESGQPPCYKCRRELRECVFEAERQYGAKRRKVADRDHDDQDFDSSINVGHDASDEPVTQSMATTIHPTGNTANASHQDTTETSIIRAVVSNGTEALDLLLQGVSHPRTGEDDRASQASPASTTQQSSVANSRQPIRPYRVQSSSGPDVRKTWQSSKFVRSGWCTAEDAVQYMDL